MSVTADNPLIEFLRGFGPSSASDSLCDENVRAASTALGVEQIDTPAARLADVTHALFDGPGRNVILTGTAGDGKTYHIRQLFIERFPDRMAEWPGIDGILKVPFGKGRELRVIRDLSEVSPSEKSRELESFASCLMGERHDRLYLVAANDGQLLKYFRDASSLEGEAGDRSRDLHGRLSEMLRGDMEEFAGLSLKLINLSRADPKALDQIFDRVLEHPAWSGCGSCVDASGATPCPIRLNRSLLRDAPEPSPVRHRLRQSLRLAAANDQHVPIRQILTLVVNAVLGDAKDPDRPLLTCAAARDRAVNNGYRYTNLYDNIVGLNLRPDRRRDNRVFKVFEVFGAGHETNNLIDSVLVQKEPENLWHVLFDQEPTYGRRLFQPYRKDYLDGAGRDPAAIRRFRVALEAQRRRAFFRLPDHVEPDMASPWRLTIFQHGGDYLKLVEALQGKDRDGVDRFVRSMVKGLNRAYTGMMANDENKLWLAGTIGKTDDLAGRVCTADPIERMNNGLFTVRVELDPVRRRPALRAAARFHQAARMPGLDLRPLVFEYLMRVANGSLPASFSRQCHQEIRHFALVTAAAIREATSGGDAGEAQSVRMLSLGNLGEIQAHQVEV